MEVHDFLGLSLSISLTMPCQLSVSPPGKHTRLVQSVANLARTPHKFIVLMLRINTMAAEWRYMM